MSRDFHIPSFEQLKELRAKRIAHRQKREDSAKQIDEAPFSLRQLPQNERISFDIHHDECLNPSRSENLKRGKTRDDGITTNASFDDEDSATECVDFHPKFEKKRDEDKCKEKIDAPVSGRDESSSCSVPLSQKSLKRNEKGDEDVAPMSKLSKKTVNKSRDRKSSDSVKKEDAMLSPLSEGTVSPETKGDSIQSHRLEAKPWFHKRQKVKLQQTRLSF